MLNPTTDRALLEALLEAEIHKDDVLPIIDVWLNGSRKEAVAMLNAD